MPNKAICRKVSSMLSLYIDNKVTYQERSFIEDHLANCNECYKKYIYLKSLIKNLKDSYKQVVEFARKKQKQTMFSIREHEKFTENLSPYVDNELSAQECFEFRKYLIKSKTAQNELKNLYIMQKEMRAAYDNTKKKASSEISKYVMNSIKSKEKQLFHNKFSDKVFTLKAAKVAILAGLLITLCYEYIHINTGENKNTQTEVKSTKNNSYKNLYLPKSQKLFKTLHIVN